MNVGQSIPSMDRRV